MSARARVVALVLVAGIVVATAAAQTQRPTPVPARIADGGPRGPDASAPGLLDADGFRLAVPPYTFAFPYDHAAHPSYRTEWWYYTGHLRAGERRFGYELTFFRIALPFHGSAKGSAWRARQVIFRHLALTDETGRKFRSDDRAERAVLDLAGADSTRYLVWLGDDYAGLEGDRSTHRLVGSTPEFALDLKLTPERPPVVHGHDGVSQKSEGLGNASHYYSFTRLATRGRVVVGGDTLAVEGRSWMDHEFGSDRLRDTHTGWDWFAVQLADGRDLMLYRMRTIDGRVDSCSSGTLVEADGHAEPIERAEFTTRPLGEWLSPKTGGRYPSGWQVRVPGDGIDLKLVPTIPDQELVAPTMGGVAYWEGSVRVSGTSGGEPVRGEGYVELTGYVGRSPFQGAALDSLRRVR
jgi:predicted secreted hydrolase